MGLESVKLLWWGGVFLNNLDIFLCGQARIVNAATSLREEFGPKPLVKE